MNEKKLLIQLKHKKSKALDTAIEHYSEYVAAIVYQLAGGALSKEDIEEVVLDIFIALWHYAHRLEKTWRASEVILVQSAIWLEVKCATSITI